MSDASFDYDGYDRPTQFSFQTFDARRRAFGRLIVLLVPTIFILLFVLSTYPGLRTWCIDHGCRPFDIAAAVAAVFLAVASRPSGSIGSFIRRKSTRMIVIVIPFVLIEILAGSLTSLLHPLDVWIGPYDYLSERRLQIGFKPVIPQAVTSPAVTER